MNGSPPSTDAALLSKLDAAGVRYLRVLWCDNANIIRARSVRIRLQGSVSVSISQGQLALPVMTDSVVAGSGLGPVGEAELVPDWNTLRLLPYAANEAAVIGDLRENGQAWAHCPRAFLKAQIERLAALGLRVQSAFENEFYLLRRADGELIPADMSVYAATSSMNQHRAFIHALTTALEAQGLEPETYYPESGPGQQELAVRYGSALESADHQIIFRETVRGTAQEHGLIASFLPKLFEHSAGSGCHINLSLWRGDENMTGDAGHPTGLSTLAQHFIAGVLHHLPALCALSIPSHNSYRRIRPHAWAGAYCTWGYANREAAVRVSRSGNGATRFELKTADASANPYLALGAVIAAGLDGVTHARTLPAEVTSDPGHLSDAERSALHVRALPTSLGEAISALEHDDVLLSALGSERAHTYLAVRRAEWEALRGLSLQEEVRLLAERY
ncbi:glutamine synthetase family protein (plasmid) [Deinococcus sp. KNUC1210]|uniref:glutamine synthetase family protein n=1 Tax=Deinococcus sp. KNUC1210 TaxID=2917691 RepID=UPI001EF06138|nr:glutamine synthetase family protein [Deinococcus sp. KNUC1210]ULH17061.1 glutamine synthetase family protein [Deinococcus sp. KNUC1210]